MQRNHIPVMAEQVLEYLQPENKRLIVDGTLGDGGHAELIMSRAGPDARLLGIDRDQNALKLASERLAPFKDRVILVHGNYSEVGDHLKQNGFTGMDAFLLDLGISSMQVDTPDRGFSFLREGPLDMRMDRKDTTTAADLLIQLSDRELEDVLKNYGEERNAKRLVRHLRKAQGKGPVTTTSHLAHILSSAVKSSRPSRIHPATRSFQALRIAVNREMEHLEAVLQDSIDLLHPKGRMAVISFHSLEDRRVKECFAAEENPCICPPRFPECVCGKTPRLKRITRRVVKPTAEEIATNPRASSARLRVAEKVHV